MRHTSTLKFTIVMAGVQLVLREASDKLLSLRKQSKGHNFCVVERDLRIQIQMVKEAVKLLESQLDRHMIPYQSAVKPLSMKTSCLSIPCPECQNPKCNGCCDRKDEEEE